MSHFSSHSFPSLLLASISFFVSSPSSSAKVIVIDEWNGPGTNFTHPNAALASAVSGDLLLIRSGTYSNVLWTQKSVSMVAEAGAQVLFRGLTLRDIVDGSPFVVRGLRIELTDTKPGCYEFHKQKALVISNCFGTILLENTVVATGYPAAEITGSSTVTFSRCTLTGGNSTTDCFFAGLYPPGAGIVATSSFINVESSTVSGGIGIDGMPSQQVPFGIVTGQPGGDAVRVIGGSVFVSGSTLTGGPGGDSISGIQGNCAPAQAGGIGINAIALAFPAQVLDSVTIAGQNGSGCDAPPQSPPIAGNVILVPGRSNRTAIPAPLREGAATTIEIEGEVNGSALLFFSGATSDSFLPVAASVFHLGLPLSVTALGNLPASGTPSTGKLVLPLVVPSFIPPSAFGRVFLQSLVCNPLGSNCRFGSPTVAILLDSAF